MTIIISLMFIDKLSLRPGVSSKFSWAVCGPLLLCVRPKIIFKINQK